MPGFETVVFYGLAALILGGAAGVAFSRNILHAAFLLLLTLSGTAGLYFFMGADFVGVAQILIYVGGILVLLLFAVLLTNRIGDVKVSNRTFGYGTTIPITVLVGAFLVSAMALGAWPRTEAVAAPTTARLGDAFLREYLLPFELVSLVLLMALVGAMVIARRAVRDPAHEQAGTGGAQ
ncbi:MAG TPA: NADH-quinone oxidoreductase subunit J [Polyangia bacterium]|jgi:NADH-quinone oxidoreductase subunit J